MKHMRERLRIEGWWRDDGRGRRAMGSWGDGMMGWWGNSLSSVVLFRNTIHGTPLALSHLCNRRVRVRVRARLGVRLGVRLGFKLGLA